MKYYILLLLSIIVFSCNSSMLFEKHSDNGLIKKILEYDTTNLFFTIKGLPKNAVKYFEKHGIILTDSGESYNETGLNFDSKMANARIIFGGSMNKRLSFVLYESDGIDSQSHLVVFANINKRSTAIETKILNCRPINFVNFKKCLQQRTWLN